MKKGVILLFFCFFLADTFAQTMTISQAINVAGRQRMLTQRLAKARIFKTAGMNVEAANRELNSSITIFEESLKNLMAYSPTDKIKDRFKKQESVWLDYKNALLNDTSRVIASFVLSYNTRVLTICDEAVQELVNYSQTLPKKDETVDPEAIANYTNVAGRLRMLSQRLTLYYGAYYSDLDKTGIGVLKNVSEEIQKGMNTLITSDINTSEIDETLSLAIKDWDVIREKCTGNNCLDFERKAMDPSQMYELTNGIVNKMNKITAMYANFAK